MIHLNFFFIVCSKYLGLTSSATISIVVVYSLFFNDENFFGESISRISYGYLSCLEGKVS
jgi:hypothetical protein